MEKSNLPSLCQSVNFIKQTFIDSYIFHLVCTNAYGKHCRKIILQLRYSRNVKNVIKKKGNSFNHTNPEDDYERPWFSDRISKRTMY